MPIGGSVVYGTPPGGGYQVTTPGGYDPSMGGPPGGMPDMSWLSEAARRSAQNKLRMQNLQYKTALRDYQHQPNNQLRQPTPMDEAGQAHTLAYYASPEDASIRDFARKQEYLDSLTDRRDFRPVEYSGHPMRNLVAAGTMSGMNFTAPAEPWIKLYGSQLPPTSGGGGKG